MTYRLGNPVHKRKTQMCNANFTNSLKNIPAAACPRCGGWTQFGGMSQHAEATTPVIGRTGCNAGGKRRENWSTAPAPMPISEDDVRAVMATMKRSSLDQLI